MELKEGCEKYADTFILKAYQNGGKVSNKDLDFVVPDKYTVGVNILLEFYGDLTKYQDYHVYVLTKDGMEFARNGAYSGIEREKEKAEHEKIRKEKADKTRWYWSIGLSIIALIIAAVTAYAQFK